MGLLELFTSKGFLVDRDHDGIPDGIAGCICPLPETGAAGKLVALNLLARFSWQCAAMPLDAIRCTDALPGDFVIGLDKALPEGRVALSEKDGGYLLAARSQESLSALAHYFYARFPYVWEVGEGAATLADWQDFPGGIATVAAVQAESGVNIVVGTKVAVTPERDIKKNPANAQAAGNAAAQVPDLLDLFSTRGIYTDPEGDMMNNHCAYRLVVDSDLSNASLIACGNLLSRMTLDCLSVTFDAAVTAQNSPAAPVLRVLQTGDLVAKLRIEQKTGSVLLSGSSQALLDFSHYLATRYPYVGSGIEDLGSLFSALNHVIGGVCAAGQLAGVVARLKATGETADQIILGDFAGIDRQAASSYLAEHGLGEVELVSCSDAETLWEKSTHLPWEGDALLEAVNAVLPALKPGDEICLQAYLGESPELRRDLESTLEKLLKQAGAKVGRCEVNSAYKQPFFWIWERVLPKLRALSPAQITIQFCPAPYRGIDDWAKFEGEIPDFDLKDEGWLDFPIRYLQELYPIDDILAQELQMPRDAIVFEAGKIAPHFILRGFDGSGAELLCESFEMKLSERLYFDEYPDMGNVFMDTGWLHMTVNDEAILDRRIKTDTELVWEFCQQELFPAAKRLLEEKTETGGEIPLPLFQTILVECDISEMDMALPCRTDWMSSAEALQENIYFVGLEFFSQMGRRLMGKPLQEPGLILPVIRVKQGGATKLRAALLGGKARRPGYVVVGEFHACPGGDTALSVDSLTLEGGVPCLHLNADRGDCIRVLEEYANLSERGMIDDLISRCNHRITLHAGSRTFTLRPTVEEKAPPPARLFFPGDGNPVSYGDYHKAMRCLERLPGANVFPVAKSFQGRDIFGIEFLDESIGDMVSRVKLINEKLTYVINNRHHANEASSTGMMFEFIKRWSTDPAYKKYSNKLNLAAIPFANVDGGAVHERLQKDNPTWMLHAARFNAVGLETRPLYFQETRYTEAAALPRMWRRWLPDLVVDNHAVPNHECRFPAFGYHRAALQENWLPRSLFFGYFCDIDDDRYRHNARVNTYVRDKVADALNEDAEIVALNEDWKDRYQKYGHAWMPDLYQADYHKNYIFYRRRQKPGSSYRNICLSYPQVTSMDWITEVADETSVGDYLRLCIKTHMTAFLGTLDGLLELSPKLENLDCESPQGVRLYRKRRRPLALE